LATLLDANVCQVNCLLDLWQDPDSGKRENGHKEMKDKIEEIIGKGWWHQPIGIFNYIFPYCSIPVGQFGPSVCWLQQVPVLFPSDGHPNNGGNLNLYYQ
jgi:hypothetical protein